MGRSTALGEATEITTRALRALHRHGLVRSAAIATKTVSPHFHWMCRFEAQARSISKPHKACPGVIEFLRCSTVDRLLLTLSPFINEIDLARLNETDALCCVMRVDSEIAGFTFMVQGRLFVREIYREIVTQPGQFYVCRSYVAPEYRGRSIMAWIKYEFANKVAHPTDRLWSLVEPRNEASIRSNISCGFNCTADVCFVSLFGLRYTIVRARIRGTEASGTMEGDQANLPVAI